jgi:dTDP-4-dehydrorhamnose reductase
VKALITGAAGQLGRALLASAPAGADLIAATRSELDLTDPVAIESFVARTDPDLVINAAAFTAVDRAESEPALARRINAAAAGQLAAAAGSSGARMIQISTDFVFDGSSSSPYAPDAATHPLSVYGSTKLEGEQAVLSALPDSAIVLRTAWVYSATGSNFLLTMLRLMGEAKPVRVVADQVGTPTAAASLAEAIWALAARRELHGIYQWTDAGVASWYDFAVAIGEEGRAAGLLLEQAEVAPIPTSDYPTPARRPAYSVLDCRSTVAATGLRQRHWRERLRDVLEEIAGG